METSKTLILLATLAVIGIAIYFLEINQATRRPKKAEIEEAQITINIDKVRKEEKAKKFEVAKEITTPDGFINVDEINIKDLIGKQVVLVDFWTYSCINCQRTFPYLNAWHEKYDDDGLTIIGVHTPEFKFEEKYENVVRATEKFGLKYSIVLDNDYSTWHAYRNRYWPRKYLIDIDGFIVYDHIGEGGYAETERKIQELLKERQEILGEQTNIESTIVKPSDTTFPDPSQIGSPEIYFGAGRNEYLGNGNKGTPGLQTFDEPNKVLLNKLYLVGEWNIQEEFAENKSNGAKIIFRFRAKEVFMVSNSENPVKARILINGSPPGELSGEDTVNATVSFKEDRLYKLINNPNGYEEHTLEIIIEDGELRAFTFTFG